VNWCSSELLRKPTTNLVHAKTRIGYCNNSIINMAILLINSTVISQHGNMIALSYDSNPAGANLYKFRRIFGLFMYVW